MKKKVIPQKKPISTAKGVSLDFFLPACLFVITLFFFKEAIFEKSRTLIWDAADYFYPYLFHVSSLYRNGELPLWNPYLFNGYPFFANMQSQAFYPINLFFILFSDFYPYVVQLQLILHYFLAGLFMYLLCTTYFENRAVCFLASLIYMLSGFMIGHMEHLSMIEVITWYPLIFLFIEKALSSAGILFPALAGLFMGVSTLAGHPQSSNTIYYFLLIHIIYRTFTIYFKERNKHIFLKSSAVVLICFGISILIAGIQIVPTFELTGESLRQTALSYEASVGGGRLSLKHAIVALIPNYYGSTTGPYWGDIDISQSLIYVGVAPSLFIGLVLLETKRVEVYYFFALMVISFLISLGEHGPIYHFLYSYLPGFDHFRGPVNSLFIYTFCASILAGYGLKTVLNYPKKSVIYLYFIFFFILSITLYWMSPSPPENLPPIVITNLENGFVYFLILFFVTVVTTSIYFVYPRLKIFFSLFIVLISLYDLHFILSNALTLGTKGSPEIYEYEPKIITDIKAHSGIPSGRIGTELIGPEMERSLFRVYTEPSGTGTGMMGYNRALLHRIFLVDGYEPLILKRHAQLEGLTDKNHENFLKISNIKYSIKRDLTTNNLSVTYYPKFLPRFFIVDKAKYIMDDQITLEELAKPSFNPTSEVILSLNERESGTPATDGTRNGPTPGGFIKQVLKYSANEIQIQTSSWDNGYLVFSDSFYPGWHGWVDGVEFPVLRANYDFKAIALPKGDHLVKFKFIPLSFKTGLGVSAFGLVLVFMIILYHRKKKPFVNWP